MQFRGTQNSFTVILYPVSIDEATTKFDVGNFSVADPPLFSDVYKATAGNCMHDIGKSTSPVFVLDHWYIGTDFTGRHLPITIPPTPNDSIGEFVIPGSFIVVDDDINEVQQSFALVAQLGYDVPDEFACFQRCFSDSDCCRRTGATEIKIVDNDRKYSHMIFSTTCALRWYFCLSI